MPRCRLPIACAALAAVLAFAGGAALAQDAAPMHHHHQMMQMPAQGGPVPTLPGQDAFGAIQEVVRILEADPATDWSKVNIEALRQHLIDMNEVTLKAAVAATPVPGGARYAVTGRGRTLAAIRRMVPAHVREMDGVDGWSAKAETLPGGVAVTVTTADPSQVAKIRGLGFIGFLVQGSHHQAHHLMMAKGAFSH